VITRRPRTKTKRCEWCRRRRASKHIEWHPGTEVWQCSDFDSCDDVPRISPPPPVRP
jgi:hypothetical protein